MLHRRGHVCYALALMASISMILTTIFQDGGLTLWPGHEKVNVQVQWHEWQRFNMTRLRDAVARYLAVDASWDAFQHAYHEGDVCPFWRAAGQKLFTAKNPLQIFVVGGSATVGNELLDPTNERWSARLSEYLSSAEGWYEGPPINVTNVAVSGCDVTCWYPMVAAALDLADVVMVDLTVNDQYFRDLSVLPRAYAGLVELLYALPKRPALLFVTTFRTANRNVDDMRKHCGNDTASQGGCCGGYYWCKRWYDMHDGAVTVLEQQGIPYISYRDLVWPDYGNPPADLTYYWNGLSHPDMNGHQLIAKAVAYMFMRQVNAAIEKTIGALPGAEVCKDTSPPPLLFERTFAGALSRPLTQMLATDSPSSKKVFTFSAPVPAAWSFYNDTGTKYGWILEPDVAGLVESCGIAESISSRMAGNDSLLSCEAAVTTTTLTVPLTLSSSRVVVISYLRSYKPHMGSVVVWVDGDRLNNVTLDGHWDSNYQLTQTATLTGSGSSKASGADVLVLPTLRAGKHAISIAVDAAALTRGPGFKWKLLGITSY